MKKKNIPVEFVYQLFALIIALAGSQRGGHRLEVLPGYKDLEITSAQVEVSHALTSIPTFREQPATNPRHPAHHEVVVGRHSLS